MYKNEPSPRTTIGSLKVSVRNRNWTADQIVPRDLAFEPEPPVRPPPLAFQRRTLTGSERQSGPIVDRWQAARALALALEIELVLRFVARINRACVLQPRESIVVDRQALRLPLHAIPADTKPFQIGFDRVDVFLARAIEIGIIETKHESAATLTGEQRID